MRISVMAGEHCMQRPSCGRLLGRRCVLASLLLLFTLILINKYIQQLPHYYSFQFVARRHFVEVIEPVPLSRQGLPLGQPPHSLPSSFIIPEEEFCTSRDLNIIAYVHSTINNTLKRQETRETWGGVSSNGVKLAVVFMVGLNTSLEEQTIVQEESKMYHDIVQGNYTDTYERLSYKALSSLGWVARHCRHVPWTLHADDDILLDPFLLTKILQDIKTTNSFFCASWKTSNVRRKGKFGVHPREYSDSQYPVYCSGAAWVLATYNIPRLLSAATHKPFLWVDDVYVTGVLARGAGLRHSKGTRKYYAQTIQNEDIGKKVVWYHIGKVRRIWWNRLLNHYSNYSETNTTILL